jgi:hypothetical protein
MDDMEHPVFGFGIEYANELLFCEAVMQDDHYEVLFNGVWVGTVAHTEDFEWMQASGTILPQSIVDEIGLRIESNYK